MIKLFKKVCFDLRERARKRAEEDARWLARFRSDFRKWDREQESIRAREAERLALRREKRAKEEKECALEEAYQRFLKTNEVTRYDAPESDDDAIRQQRRDAMRFAKDMQDSMPD
jgi:hypothetical protein